MTEVISARAPSARPPRPDRRTRDRLLHLCADVAGAPRAQPLPATVVDRCAWWLPWLHRRRRAPWTSLRSALLARLRERVVSVATLGERSPLLIGHIYVIGFARRCAGPWKVQCW